MTGDRAVHVDQSLLDVGLDDLQVLLRDALDAEMAGHLLARESTARILAVTGRTVRAVRDRDAVGGAETAEVPALHRTGEALADRGAHDIDKLAGHEMRGGELGTDFQKVLLGDPEFRQLPLRLNLRLGEVAALSLGDVLHLGLAHTELNGVVAVRLVGAHGNDLAVIDLEHGHRDVVAVGGEDAGHAHLLGEETGTHGCLSSST